MAPTIPSFRRPHRPYQGVKKIHEDDYQQVRITDVAPPTDGRLDPLKPSASPREIIIFSNDQRTTSVEPPNHDDFMRQQRGLPINSVQAITVTVLKIDIAACVVVFKNTVTHRDGRGAWATRRKEREYLSYLSDEQRRRTEMRRSSNAIVFMKTTT